MKEFVFIGDVEAQMNEFKQNAGDFSIYKSATVTFDVGTSMKVSEITKNYSIISKLFSENTNIKMNVNLKQLSNDNSFEITVKCYE